MLRRMVLTAFLVCGIWYLTSGHAFVPGFVPSHLLPGRGEVPVSRSSTPLVLEEVKAAPEYDTEELTNIAVYKRLLPSVVNVTSTTVQMDFFYGAVPSQGQGSGFILDKQGHIATNYHVIADAQNIEVQTSDKHRYKARIIGKDQRHDLALLQIDAPNLQPVLLAQSHDLVPGQKVYAIGNPFGLNGTMTTGIISAIRSIRGPAGGQIENAIQTDAAINPGNSGGPLLNMLGEVVGVNAAIFTQSNGYQGIGFAIPASTVVNVYNQLIGPEHKVIRGSIGISFQPNISPAVAKLYNAGNGVLISQVTPGGPADKAGLKPNDVILTVDGTAVKSGDDLVGNISPRRPGTSVTIGYLRNGTKQTATVSIADRTQTVTAANAGNNDNSPSDNGGGNSNASKTKLGLTVADLPSNAPSGFHGVVVQAIKPGSFADDLSPALQPGVIIEAINKKPVHNKAEFDGIVAGLKSGDDVVLEYAFPRAGKLTSLTGGTLP